MTRESGQSTQAPGSDDGENSPAAIARISVRGSIIAASITAVAGLIGIAIPAIIGNSGGQQSAAPTPQPQLVLASPSSVFPTLNSSPPTSPSPAQEPSSTASVPPTVFNNEQTDPTQINVGTMLPQQFNDADSVFHRTSGSVQSCPMGNEASDVANSLRDYGCTSAVVGTYLDSSAQMQISVWVFPMPDATAAAGVWNASDQFSTNDWGIWCPGAGVGSQICQEPWRSATSYGRIGYCHRYLMHAAGWYVDFRSGDAAVSELTLAVTAANRSIGAHNIPAAQC